MCDKADEEWEKNVMQAEQSLREGARLASSQNSNWKLNICLFLLPLAVFALALFLPRQLEGLAFAIWIIGGAIAFAVLIVYANSNKVSYTTKEAALSFILGNLIVFGLFLLNPV